jgi:hypothetical protein
MFGEEGSGAPFHGWNSSTIAMQMALPNLPLLTPANAFYVYAGIPRKGMNSLWGHVASNATFRFYVLHRGSGGAGGVYGMADTVNSILDVQTGLQMVSIENLHMRGNAFTIGITLIGLFPMTALTYYLELQP